MLFAIPLWRGLKLFFFFKLNNSNVNFSFQLSEMTADRLEDEQAQRIIKLEKEEGDSPVSQ